MNRRAFRQSASSGFERPQDFVVPVDDDGRRRSDASLVDRQTDDYPRLALERDRDNNNNSSSSSTRRSSFDRSACKGFERPDNFLGSPHKPAKRTWKTKRVVDSPVLLSHSNDGDGDDRAVQDRTQHRHSRRSSGASASETRTTPVGTAPLPSTPTGTAVASRTATTPKRLQDIAAPPLTAHLAPTEQTEGDTVFADLRRLAKTTATTTSTAKETTLTPSRESRSFPHSPTTVSSPSSSSFSSAGNRPRLTPDNRAAAPSPLRTSQAVSMSNTISPLPLTVASPPAASKRKPPVRRWTPSKDPSKEALLPPAFRASFSKSVSRPPLTPRSRDTVVPQPTNVPDAHRIKTKRRRPDKLKSKWPPTTAKPADVSNRINKSRLRAIVKPEKPVRLITTTIEQDMKAQVVRQVNDSVSVIDEPNSDGDGASVVGNNQTDLVKFSTLHQGTAVVCKSSSTPTDVPAKTGPDDRDNGHSVVNDETDSKSASPELPRIKRQASLKTRYDGPTLLPIDDLYGKNGGAARYLPDQLDSRFLVNRKLHTEPPKPPVTTTSDPKYELAHDDDGDEGQTFHQDLANHKTKAVDKIAFKSNDSNSSNTDDGVTANHSADESQTHKSRGGTLRGVIIKNERGKPEVDAPVTSSHRYSHDDMDELDGPGLNRPDVWVTPMDNSELGRLTWRVKRVWGVAYLDNLEQEHEIDDADLFDEVRALLGVPLDRQEDRSDRNIGQWHVKKVYHIDGIIDESEEESGMCDEDLLAGFKALSTESETPDWEDSISTIRPLDDSCIDNSMGIAEIHRAPDTDTRESSCLFAHGHRAYCRPDDWVSPQERRSKKKLHNRGWKVKKVWDASEMKGSDSDEQEETSARYETMPMSASASTLITAQMSENEPDDASINIGELVSGRSSGADQLDDSADLRSPKRKSGSKTKKKKRDSKREMTISDLLSPPPVFEMSFSESTD